MNGIKKLTGCNPVCLYEPSHYWLSEVVVDTKDIARLRETIFNNLVDCSREGQKCFNSVNNGSFEIVDLDEHYLSLTTTKDKAKKTPTTKSKSSTSSRETVIVDNSPAKGKTTNVSKKSMHCHCHCY